MGYKSKLNFLWYELFFMETVTQRKQNDVYFIIDLRISPIFFKFKISVKFYTFIFLTLNSFMTPEKG